MKILLILDFPSQTVYLVKFLSFSYRPKCSWPIRLQDSSKCNTSTKNWGIKLIFSLQINIKSFLQVAAFAFDGCFHARPNYPKEQVCDIFAIFQERYMGDKHDLLHEDKHVIFLQADSIVFTGYSQASRSTQNNKFVITFSSLHYPKKERRNKADFLHADKHQTFLQVDTINLGGYGQVCRNYTK